MKNREGFGRLVSPLRVWSQRLVLLMLALSACAMIILNRADPAFLERLRTGVSDTVTPILEALSKPAEAVREAGDDIKSAATLKKEVEELRAELSQLRTWRARAQTLDSENRELRKLLDMTPETQARYIGARIVGDSGSAFVRSMLINAGTDRGVTKGFAVVSSEGLIGRVVEAGGLSARVLLITDLNSRIPVRIGSSRDRGILAGNNSDLVRLLFLPATSTVRKGDRIVTSGHGGVFPPGLPVGLVESVNRTDEGHLGKVLIRPFVNWNQIEHVRVVDFKMPGLVLGPKQPQAAAAGKSK